MFYSLSRVHSSYQDLRQQLALTSPQSLLKTSPKRFQSSFTLLRLILVSSFSSEASPSTNPSQENTAGHILTCLAVQSLRELVNGRRHLQAFVEDGPLALQPDVAWPFHKPSEIALRLDILS